MIGARAITGLALALAAVTFGGTVTNIHDGDTYRFRQVRVRIAGMDAPELETRFGPGSRDHLAQLIAGQRVTCQDSGERSRRPIEAWRRDHNDSRPHSALGNLTPPEYLAGARISLPPIGGSEAGS